MSPLPADLRRVLGCIFPPDELAAALPIIEAACPTPECLPRAELHKRTHEIDLLACPCGGLAGASLSGAIGSKGLLERLGAKIHAGPGPIPAPVSNRPDRPRSDGESVELGKPPCDVRRCP